MGCFKRSLLNSLLQGIGCYLDGPFSFRRDLVLWLFVLYEKCALPAVMRVPLQCMIPFVLNSERQRRFFSFCCLGNDANLVETSREGVFPNGLILGQGLRLLELSEVSVGARSR